MITENVKKILSELPDQVKLVAAAKEKTAEDILEAIQAGVKIIGENYIGEAKRAYKAVGNRVLWHFIGISHKQKHNFLRKSTMEMFDMIETIDSLKIAEGVDGICKDIGKVMPILIEINSGREPQKSGVLPEDVEALIREISKLRNVKIMGLMTMGPRFGNPEDSRPYFRETRKIFEQIKEMDLPNVEMKYLSMGMTNSYLVALSEGANMVRIGTKIFGEKTCNRVNG
ncbi:MAG: YggS family pyridoxal phosphate-dependent enzyme [Syntrophaceae bacterium]|nr:YggS family pyridoxal phosphate-dependent enzyme [Syntrophaceae bacterium]